MGGAMHDYSGHPTRIATEETRKKGSLLRKLGTEGEGRLSVDPPSDGWKESPGAFRERPEEEEEEGERC